MPITARVDVASACVFLTMHGKVTSQDFADTRAALTADPSWSPSFSVVADLTSADETSMSGEDVRQLAHAAILFSSVARRVLVAKPGTVAFGLARMFQMHASSGDIQIVDSIEAARALIK